MIISSNKKAYHDYEILETLEVGLVLTGPEIKAIRAKRINLKGSYVKVLSGQSNPPAGRPELFLINANFNVIGSSDKTRSRKLLAHRKEINKLIGKTQEKNLTLIPTKLYLRRGKAKLQIAIGRGKKLHDKRSVLKKRDTNRDTDRELKKYQ